MHLPHDLPHTEHALHWDGLLPHEIKFHCKSTTWAAFGGGKRPPETSLDVLHLFAHLLDGHLHLDGDRRQLDRGGFGAERVGLAQKFLDQEIESLAEFAADAQRDRALNEAAAYAIRIDVAEELGRLNAHLDEISRLLTSGGELGKRLDFLIQELQREANTLGSKSAALELTQVSVEMKVAIEQMREQVQNIE